MTSCADALYTPHSINKRRDNMKKEKHVIVGVSQMGAVYAFGASGYKHGQNHGKKGIPFESNDEAQEELNVIRYDDKYKDVTIDFIAVPLHSINDLKRILKN